MNLLQILKNSASIIYAKYLKNNEIEKEVKHYLHL